VARFEKSLLQSVVRKYQRCKHYFVEYIARYQASYEEKPCTVEDHSHALECLCELTWIRELSVNKGFEDECIAVNTAVLGAIQEQIVRLTSYFQSILQGNGLGNIDFGYTRSCISYLVAFEDSGMNELASVVSEASQSILSFISSASDVIGSLLVAEFDKLAIFEEMSKLLPAINKMVDEYVSIPLHVGPLPSASLTDLPLGNNVFCETLSMLKNMRDFFSSNPVLPTSTIHQVDYYSQVFDTMPSQLMSPWCSRPDGVLIQKLSAMTSEWIELSMRRPSKFRKEYMDEMVVQVVRARAFIGVDAFISADEPNFGSLCDAMTSEMDEVTLRH